MEWVTETAYGTIHWRKRQLGQLFADLQAIDTLIVSGLSQLGRSMLECMKILSLAVAVKGNWQLDDSLQSKILAMTFAMAAEIKRELISQRTTEVNLSRWMKRHELKQA